VTLQRVFKCLVLTVAAAASALALAQAPVKPKPAPEEPRFEIRRFTFDGATLVPKEQLETETQPFVGAGKTFADVQRALETIERIYSRSGFSAVQVVLPEQELDKGEIRFQIVEAKLGRVIVEGNKFFDEANVRASLPSLKPGTAPNINSIARDLRIANENPAKQTTVLLRSGQEEAMVDAVARVVDEDPIKGSVTVDSSGSPKTGRLRVGFGYQNAHFLGTDHVLTAQYVTAPYRDEDAAKDKSTFSLIPSRNVLILGAGYRMPLYDSGNTLDFTAAYSNVSTGQVAGFNITGMGTIFGARYTQNLNRIGDYEHRVSYSFDHRSYENKGIRPEGSTDQATPDLVVHPISVQYSGAYRRQDSETAFSIGIVKNIKGGKDGRATEFCLSRSVTVPGSLHFECARAGFQLWRWAFNHNIALGDDWQFRFSMNGQQTRDMLVSGEQFGVGGVDSVRGFLEREVIADTGRRGTVELYTPDWGTHTGIGGLRARAVVFYDWGYVRRIRPGPSEPHKQSIASVGAGLRFSRSTNVIFRTDLGVVVDEGGGGATVPPQSKGDSRLTFSLSYVY
jgi:hemolysin activation/secretion protein